MLFFACFLLVSYAKTLPVIPEGPKINAPSERSGGALICFSGSHLYGRGTRLLKPMKAMARIPAGTSAMGTPFMPLGVPVSSSYSRMPAKMTSARVKPTAMEAE